MIGQGAAAVVAAGSEASVAEPAIQDVPRDFDSLKARIIARRAALPRRLMQVAVHSIEHPDDIAFGTAASVAAAAEVQPSTLVRFAQYFGYDGFSDLQQVFRERLRERTTSYDERLAAIEAGVKGGSREGAILNGFLAAAHASIQALAQTVDVTLMGQAVSLLSEAETIYLLAQRRSFPITSYMAYAFGKLKVRSVLVGSPAGIDRETLALAGPKDAAIAVTFSPYASSTVDHARQLAQQDVPIVAITDSAFSPLAELARFWFEVAEADFSGFRSLSATMALAMALTVGIAEQRRQAAT
jgi:DNA-binding MurR/RpiR family transcriptional regulator